MLSEKLCMRCGTTYTGDLKNYFHRDNGRASGIVAHCKKCKAEKDSVRQKKSTINDAINSKRNILRGAAKYQYRGLYNKCSILQCEGKAELHHLHYKNNSSILPVCRDHHSEIHSYDHSLSIVAELLVHEEEQTTQFQSKLKTQAEIIEVLMGAITGELQVLGRITYPKILGEAKQKAEKLINEMEGK